MVAADSLAIEGPRTVTQISGATQSSARRRVALRIGGWSGVIGALLALVANALHPHPGNFQLETVLTQIAHSNAWGAIHLTLIVALLFVFVALTALALSLEREPAATLGRLACVVALLGGALLLVSTATDGFAMSRLADDWINAPVAEQAAALHAASAVEETQYAIYSLSTVIFLGLGIMLYGIATLLDGGYPRWLGWLAILSGAGEVVIGTVQALSGPTSRSTELPDTLLSVLITLWLLLMSVVMLRRSQRKHPAHPRSKATTPTI